MATSGFYVFQDNRASLEEHRLRVYLFNDYYLKYFSSQLARSTPAYSLN